jgi:periplasmic glucans biosynthesis protein
VFTDDNAAVVVAKLALAHHADTRSLPMASVASFVNALLVLLCVALMQACGGLASQPASQPASGTTTNTARVNIASSSKQVDSAPPAFFPLLVERARGLGAAPPRPAGTVALPPSLRDIDYERYRTIRYKPEQSLWRGQPGRFEAQFFHMGYAYRDPVAMFAVEGQEARAIPFSTDLFSYDGVPKPPPPDPATLQFTGVRLHAPLNRADYRDEFAVFQGSSYFRVVGQGQAYGLSARGLAIDTGEPTAEEFPRFTELYLQKPGADDEATWVMALLESRRATGAFAMRIEPGARTTVEVVARIFLREGVRVLGVAPLTSMYLFGEEHPARFGDYRPEVHDSDGLSMWAGNGEWVYRPLRNPARTTVCTFRLDSPRGFGLLQRDRRFDSYQDLDSRYQDRPSAWIEPLSDWGKGAIRLLEITTQLESDDNVAMVWVPDEVPSEGLSLHYRLHFGLDLPVAQPLGRVADTRFLDQGVDRGRFVVEFVSLPTGGANAEPRLDVNIAGGRVLGTQLLKNPFTNGYRASIDVARDQSDDIELRAVLRDDSHALTETWSYLWQPKR